MDTGVTSSPDLSVEIPVDSSKTPPWFEGALAAPRKEGWLDSAGCPIHYFSWGNPANPGVYSSMGSSHTRDVLHLLRLF